MCSHRLKMPFACSNFHESQLYLCTVIYHTLVGLFEHLRYVNLDVEENRMD